MNSESVQNTNLFILKEYEEFREKNELVYSSYKIIEQKSDFIKAVFCTTRKYKNFNTKKIEQDYKEFCKENKPYECSITKITNQDFSHIVEFSVFKSWRIFD